MLAAEPSFGEESSLRGALAAARIDNDARSLRLFGGALGFLWQAPHTWRVDQRTWC